MKKAYDFLEEGAATYRERNAVYGDNYLRVGGALAALFPDGVTLKTEDDHNRFHIFALKVVKLSRYCVNWEKGGHEDSLLDDTVYGAMLLEIDRNIRERPIYQGPGSPIGTVVDRIEDTLDPPLDEEDIIRHIQMSDDGCPNPPFAGSHRIGD